MTFVTVTALCSQLLRKEMVKRWHLIGSKVQAQAATGKAWLPTVDSRVQLTISDEDEVECSR